MPSFEYKGFDKQGRVSRGLVQAPSTKEARDRLAGEGILAEELSSTGRKIRFPGDMRAIFYRELAALLDAGLPLARALDTMIHSPEARKSRLLLAAVRDRIMEGGALAAALAEVVPSITPFERAILEVGERSALLELNLVRLADYMDEQDKLLERIRGALTYPVFVIGIGICSAVIMLGVLVPMMEKMLLHGNVQLPTLTRVMMSLGGILSHWVTLVMTGLAGVGLFLFRQRTIKDEALRQHMAMYAFRIPWYGRGLTLLVSLRFSRALAMLIRSGATLIDGLVMAGRATGNAWVASLTAKEAEAVRNGEALSHVVVRIPPLAESLPGWIQTGEASGALAAMLETAAGRYQEYWSRYVNRCMGLLAPALILLVGGFVLVLALSVLLPVFSLSQSLSSPPG